MIPKFTVKNLVEWSGGKLLKGKREDVIKSISTDTRTLQKGEIFLALEGPNFNGREFISQAKAAGASGVILKGVQPQLSNSFPIVIQVEDTLKALGDIAKSYRSYFSPRTIGITGSVGKTTTRRFTGSILEQENRVLESQKNFNNLIGVPLTLLKLETTHEFLLLELGADRVGEMELLTEYAQADIGAISAISESHLERFGSIETIIREKARLLESLSGKGSLGIVNLEGGYTQRLLECCKTKVIKVGIERGDCFAKEVNVLGDGTVEFVLNLIGKESPVHLNTLGKHNIPNALIAAAICNECGIGFESIISGLEKFKGFTGRGIKYNLPGNILLIDDCYNSNPSSMTAAIDLAENFKDRRKIFVAGEMWDLGSESKELHRQVGGRLAGADLDMIVFIGTKTQDMLEILEVSGSGKETYYCEDSKESFAVLQNHIRPGDLVYVKGSRGLHLENLIKKLITLKYEKTNGGGILRECFSGFYTHSEMIIQFLIYLVI